MEARERLVIDCSVTLAWFFEDEASHYADAVQESLPDVGAVVPSIWPLEVANGLIVGERRGRVDEEKSTRFLRLLDSFPISVENQTSADAFGHVLHLGRARGLTAYDAAYLELAMR